MRSKQIQIKHWQKYKYPCPHKTTLQMFWNRSGIKAEESIMRIFRLELLYLNKPSKRRKRNTNSKFLRLLTITPDYSLAA